MTTLALGGRLMSYAGLRISVHYWWEMGEIRVTLKMIRPQPGTCRRDMPRDMLRGRDMQFCGIRS